MIENKPPCRKWPWNEFPEDSSTWQECLSRYDKSLTELEAIRAENETMKLQWQHDVRVGLAYKAERDVARKKLEITLKSIAVISNGLSDAIHKHLDYEEPCKLEEDLRMIQAHISGTHITLEALATYEGEKDV